MNKRFEERGKASALPQAPGKVKRRRILVDVGAHEGQTVIAAVEAGFRFDQIHCLEPSPESAAQLRRLRLSELTVHEAALWSSNGKRRLHGSGSQGASLFGDKAVKGSDSLTSVRLIDVRDWLNAYTRASDHVFLKLNCEGSECEILDALVQDTDLRDRVKSILVYFDALKVPSQAHRVPQTMEKCKEAGLQLVDSRSMGTHHDERIQKWLAAQQVPRSRFLRARSLTILLNFHLPVGRRMKRAARRLLGHSRYAAFARRLRQSRAREDA